VIEEARLKKLEDEHAANEELHRLAFEENNLQPWKRNYEESLISSLKSMVEDEEWNKYAFCENRYINIRKEKDLNGFIYEFKERCDLNFIANFKLIEKSIQEEMFQFDHSQMHYYNLNRYLLEGKATKDLKILSYAYNYLTTLTKLKKKKLKNVMVKSFPNEIRSRNTR